nr:P27 family phage terminase small subunit [Allomuricauda sp.]
MDIAHKNKEGVVSIAPENKELYDVLEKLPRPKKDMKLTKEQKRWWTWFGVEFLKTKQLSELDLVHLQKAAFWMDLRSQAYEIITEKGYKGGVVQTYSTGAQQISPHLTVVEKADKALDDISAHFGLSIKDRHRLKKTEKIDPGQLDLFEAYMKKKAN